MRRLVAIWDLDEWSEAPISDEELLERVMDMEWPSGVFNGDEWQIWFERVRFRIEGDPDA